MKAVGRVVALLGCLLPARAPAVAQGVEPWPNVLVIVSDDHGYVDAGFQGGTDVPTPHIDRLAASGVRCTSGYVSHPFCSPTRAGLLTGRHQARFGHENNPVYDPLDAAEGLPLGERILPQLVKTAGYATGWVGKWHLGASPEHAPWARGFDDTFGFIGGGHRFIGWRPDGRQYTLPLVRQGRPIDDVPAHLTAALGDEAAAFVRRHAGHPWLLYLAFNAPHTPHEPTAEREARFAHVTDPRRRRYLAQVSLLDDAIGGVTRALAESGQAGRTLVFFCSDNGGPVKNGALNGPLRGQKGQLYEGGIRVPFVVSWPDRLPADRSYDQPVSSLDVFATVLAAAGVPHPRDKQYDGVDLLPYLAGTAQAPPHERLFWRLAYGRGHAVREGRWKLVRSKDQPDELYDLAADVAEANDLAAAEPAVVSRLAAAVDAWTNELVDPVFPGASIKSEDWGPGGANQKGHSGADPRSRGPKKDGGRKRPVGASSSSAPPPGGAIGSALTAPRTTTVTEERAPDPSRQEAAAQAADRVLAGLVRVTPPQVQAAHDAEMTVVGRRAHDVAEVNDVRPAEGAGWPAISSAPTVVDLDRLVVERFVPFARGGQRFDHATLPEGSCFAPRIIRKDDAILWCFFATERPGGVQSQVWFIDHDAASGRFATAVHKAQLKTAAGEIDSVTKRQKPYQRAVIESIAEDVIVLSAPPTLPVPAGTLIRNDAAPNLIAVGGVRRCTIRHVHSLGVALHAVADPVVEDCRIEDTSDEAVDLDHFTIRSRVVGTRMERCLVGVELDDANECLVERTHFIGCGTGITLRRWCPMPDLNQRNTIVRNVFRDTRGNGIQIGDGTALATVDETEILRSGSSGVLVAGPLAGRRDNVIRDSGKQDVALRD